MFFFFIFFNKFVCNENIAVFAFQAPTSWRSIFIVGSLHTNMFSKKETLFIISLCASILCLEVRGASAAQVDIKFQTSGSNRSCVSFALWKDVKGISRLTVFTAILNSQAHLWLYLVSVDFFFKRR